MQVVCKDGTAIQCSDFEAIDSGVLLFQEQQRREGRAAKEEEESETERSATGFVPITELKFVVPDELLGGARGQQAVQTEQGRAAPPSAPGGTGGQVAQQQQMQRQPGPGQGRYDTGGQ